MWLLYLITFCDILVTVKKGKIPYLHFDFALKSIFLCKTSFSNKISQQNLNLYAISYEYPILPTRLSKTGTSNIFQKNGFFAYTKDFFLKNPLAIS